MVFNPEDAVAPDVIWISREREDRIRQEGRLNGAPELVVEVLSPGAKNEQRDRVDKLRLYSEQGVMEYWIVDWRRQTVEIYRPEQGTLRLAIKLGASDMLTSPVLPGFTCPVARFFAEWPD